MFDMDMEEDEDRMDGDAHDASNDNEDANLARDAALLLLLSGSPGDASAAPLPARDAGVPPWGSGVPRRPRSSLVAAAQSGP